ncbi:MAG TPA: NRDE family protein [Anaeromyxobacteraceae bacterium]|nr:NRDE family protein [Anaeromyxobacteraceae bacterium]
MCTLAVAFQVDARWPLVVAANRDERKDRPWEDWGLRTREGALAVLAPRDLVAGGTWIGVNAGGVFSGITNYHLPATSGPDPSRRSRGEIVSSALARQTAREARRSLGALAAGAYNPFHLLVADAESAFLWWYDGESAEFEDLPPGLHVVTENSPFGRCRRGEWIRGHWPLEPSPPHLRDLLAVHGSDPFQRTCIHLDPVYGTRSTAVLRLARSLEVSELYATVGPPCTNPLEDRSDLLASLARGA